MTGAGPLANEVLATGNAAPQQMMNTLHDVVEKCKKSGVRILFDAESQKYQSGIFETGMQLMQKHNREGYAAIYNTYQGYLKSTPATIKRHLALAADEGFTLGLKLVRGAYLDTDQRDLIHDTKQDTDAAYNYIAQGALRRELCGFGGENDRPFPSVNLLLAGHNKESMYGAYELHRELLQQGKPTVPVAMAQLHGMADAVSFGLLSLQKKAGDSRGPDLYKCSTWGTLEECTGYLSRRAYENRDAASRTVDEYAALKFEAWRRFRSLLGFAK